VMMLCDVFRVQGRFPKKERNQKKIGIILFMHALFSGSMSGSSAYILKMKSHLLGPKSEEKQDKDDYTCEGQDIRRIVM
jgi:hypothetical protein